MQQYPQTSVGSTVSMEASSSRSVVLPSDPAPPRQILTTDTAVAQWHTTPGFRGFWGWTTRRCDRIKGKQIMEGSNDSTSVGVNSLMALLDDMTTWVGEAPPQPQSSQRFGNLAFREYIRLVNERLPNIIATFPDIPPQLAGQILPLLLNSTAFGHQTRLDYGTGHELAFVLTLWCCVVSGWIGVEGKEQEEDELVLRVFPRYLELVTMLQTRYRLEPAGSHGVWGLDDYCFFSYASPHSYLRKREANKRYLFGSAQLLDSDVTPTEALRRATQPTSSSITDMYTLSLHRITLFKSGAAFSEHSPLLHQLSSFPDWKKPHAGLRKMFMGEVAGKKVVVQGLWVGGWVWGPDMLDDRGEKTERASTGNRATSSSPVVTPAPWARTDARERTLEATRGDWGATALPRR